MNPVCADGKRIAVPAAKFFLLASLLFMACHKPVKIRKTAAGKASGDLVLSIVQPPDKVKTKKKKLYLTFDDGPNKGTRNVLHMVQDEQLAASFFIVGQHVAGSTWQRQLWDSLQAAPNIALCNHSYTHAENHYAAYYENPEGVVEDFQRTQDSLGFTNRVVRTPGRNIWRTDSLRYTDMAKSTAAADSLQKAGFILIGWDVEWKFDPKTMSVTTTADNLLTEIDSSFAHHNTRETDNLVLLAHDQVYTKSDDSMQLRRFLQKLKQRNEYEILLVTDYPGAGKLNSSIARR